LDEYYFDIQSFGPSKTPIDESQLIKLVTKLSVGVATVWWTAIELKDYIKLRKTQSILEDSINDILSGKNS
jgi:hypothetical protein